MRSAIYITSRPPRMPPLYLKQKKPYAQNKNMYVRHSAPFRLLGPPGFSVYAYFAVRNLILRQNHRGRRRRHHYNHHHRRRGKILYDFDIQV